MSLWSKEYERVDCRELDEHEDEHKDDLIENEILDIYVRSKESSGGPIEDYMTRSIVDELMEYNIKKAFEDPTRGINMGIVKKLLRKYLR